MDKLSDLIINLRERQHNIYPLIAKIHLSDQELNEFATKLLPKLYKLFDDGHVRKDIVFLSLLANPQTEILSIFVEYEINQPLNLHHGLSLFTHCYYQNKNWFANILNAQQNSRIFSKYFDGNIQNVIKTLQIIQLTNLDVVDIDVVQCILSDIDTKNLNDEFIVIYVNEIKYILSILTYCKQHIKQCSLNETDLFKWINNAKLLNVFCKYLCLGDASKWQGVLDKLKIEERRFEFNSESDTTSTDIHEFNCYVILANIIKALEQCKRTGSNDKDFNITQNINNAKDTLVNLNPKLQIQVLEDIFTICFLQWESLHDSNDLRTHYDNETFICSDHELRLLLHFLMPCIDDLTAQIPIRSAESVRLQELNRHVKEALWRLEMLDDMQSFDMSHMLSDAETLMKTSLKKGRFDKVHQVIQIFNLHESELAQEIIYTEKLNDLRATLQQAFKLQDLQKQIPNYKSQSNDKDPKRILAEFFAREQCSCDQHDILDIACILTTSRDNTRDLLECIRHSTTFYEKISVLFYSMENASLQEILAEPKYEFDLEIYNSKLLFYDELRHSLNAFYRQLSAGAAKDSDAHLVYRSYAELKQLAGLRDMKEVSYFHRLFNYLKIFLRAFNTEGNNCDMVTRGSFLSYFEILKHSRFDWIGKLLFERKLDPRDFEHLFGKLKIDLLYCTASNCFPEIRLCNYRCTLRRFQEPTRVVFSYIAKRNWLLAFIINEIFGLLQMDVNETRTKYFTQYINTQEIDNLKILFGNNKVVTALNQDYYDLCLDYLNKNIFESELLVNGDAVEAAEEILEGDLKCNWMNLLLLIDSISEAQHGSEIDHLRDKILTNLVVDAFEEEGYMYVKFVKNDAIRRELILENFITWPGDFCISLLKGETDMELLKWSERIQFCEDIRHLFDFLSWYAVHDLCLVNPNGVFHRLLGIPKASLLLNFQKFYHVDDLVPEIPIDYIALLFNYNEELNRIELLLDKLEDPIGMCLNLINIVRNLNQLEFIIEYLLQKKYPNENFIKNVRISSKILRQFPTQERDHLWCLIKTPLAIIEMLIMNTKLDKLGNVLEGIRNDLENCEFNDNVISLEAIDDLLRKYTEKSLEFRVILEPHPSLLNGSEGKLMESLDSNYGPDRKYFQMPEQIPTKTEWIPNNEVLECMCCQNTTFSMFNRRHHCRRCGRVICFNCSTKRMQVPTYGDILVRVCLDCYDQSQTDSKSDSTSTKSVMYDHWFLSDRAEHNTIVRQEFSYEHAPSVSLCLSIMKHHTKTYSYPKFLLDQCDVMLKLLQPPAQNAPQEVDYVLVIKMLKSLAIAAKMLSSECQLPWGSSQADRILSQADLFALLAERGCLNLLPPSSSGAPYVDAIILRKLRDKLLMQEQWHFALDVSTKAGLENAGVFAAWGKSCLKAGCLQLAREKFQRCFDKSGHCESLSLSFEDESIDGSYRSKYSRISMGSDNKPLKNPPILEQIIDILESQTISLTNNNPARATNKEKECAILIKAKLRNLKSIANGNLDGRTDFKGCNLDPVYFQECLYYLKKYGSHLGLLQFYLRHNCIKESLIYMYDNKVNSDIFIEVYTICLRDGKINQLQKGMSRIDSTLEIWKDYLKAICRHLEKQGLLNSLYQLQQFMVDFVRAAMTCIRFYKDNSTSYQELSSKIHFLNKAEAHLLQELEQQQWVEVNAVVNTMSCDSSYEEKTALSNPSLVMKMDSRTIDQHIRTIKRQIQITGFLGLYEKSDMQFMQLLPYITPNIEGESTSMTHKQLPTLFDSHSEKVQLAVLLIICGDKIQDGYDLAHGLIQDYKLKALKVYCQAGRQLAREDRYQEIAELVSCIRSKGLNEPGIINICDEMLTLAVRTLSRNDVPTPQLEVLIKLITDRATKISIYIETKQLKSAYLLAARYNRFGDIRRILREAELINKQDIKKLCQKLLQVHSHSKD